VFVIEAIHPPGVDKDQDNEDVNRTLLSHPESSWEFSDFPIIERFDQYDSEAKRDKCPDRKETEDEAACSTPVTVSGRFIFHKGTAGLTFRCGVVAKSA
jgi:hypothetical protein